MRSPGRWSNTVRIRSNRQTLVRPPSNARRVVIAASRCGTSIDEEINARHALVHQLLDNGWLHLFRLGDRDGGIHRRVPGQGWVSFVPQEGE